MPTPDGSLLVEVAPADTAWPCGWDGCPKAATHTARFHGQAGHVHDCTQHTAVLREWSDVAEVVPLPCPFPHGDGTTWTDDPRPLA